MADSVQSSAILALDHISVEHQAQVGGKAFYLAMLARAGFPVPPGFLISATIEREIPDQALFAEVERHYQELGEPRVAVRSSALGEDAPGASFAGQYGSTLNVRGVPAILAAIERCRESLQSDHVAAYRRLQSLLEADPRMAILVQRQIEAEVAGILFTRDPRRSDHSPMIIEASPGMGCAVALGTVTPDRYEVCHETGQVQAGPIDGCLDAAQLARLANLGREVETFFGQPQDIEWACSKGQCWILQARPITSHSQVERERIREEEIAALRAQAAKKGTIWARCNLAEVLPEPTPLTWSLISASLSGRGALGHLYKDLGFEPSAAVAEKSAYDLVCGRPFCNWSREPAFYAGSWPLEHYLAEQKSDIPLTLAPRTRLNLARVDSRFWFRVPFYLFRAWRTVSSVRHWEATLPAFLQDEWFPSFAGRVQQARQQDLRQLHFKQLLDGFEEWRQATLVTFARHGLKPAALAQAAAADLEQALLPRLGPLSSQQALSQLTRDVRPDPEADVARALADYQAGQMEWDTFVGRFGHRGPGEMELALPRWAEWKQAPKRSLFAVPGPVSQTTARDENAWEEIARKASWAGRKARRLAHRWNVLRTHLALRETAKHYYLMGYALLRAYLVEIARRRELGDGIFFLEPQELPQLAAGRDFWREIRQRRRRRALALSIEVPPVLESRDLDAIGRPSPRTDSAGIQGVPISPGVAEGQVQFLRHPSDWQPTTQAVILVCTTADPAWVPLFRQVAGVIMDTGGVLSHGAIVARELGLPAIGGVSAAEHRLRAGQRVRINGSTGTVEVLGDG